MERDEGTVEVLNRPNFVLGAGFLFVSGLVLLIGFLSAVTGQHFPHMTWLGTSLWALGVGALFGLLGYIFTGTKDHFIVSYDGVRAEFSRYRFLRWTVSVPAQSLQFIHVEPINQSVVYRVWIQSKGRPELEVASRLDSESAWQLASMMAEPGQWMVKG